MVRAKGRPGVSRARFFLCLFKILCNQKARMAKPSAPVKSPLERAGDEAVRAGEDQALFSASLPALMGNFRSRMT